MQVPNEKLQNQLDKWAIMLQEASENPHGSSERREKVRAFCKTFVPSDVNEEDTFAYADGLSGDEEYFKSFLREMKQCATGERVESISKGETEHSFVFTLLAPEGEGISLDIVRELAYISFDGETWTAEG